MAKDLLKQENWGDAFLLPLTGLKKDPSFEMRSHLFWDEYNINDYKLILTFTSDDVERLNTYCSSKIFPILDKKGYLLESYDIGNKSIFILDMSEWAKDIEMFIMGKYSKFSKDAKILIEKYHTYNKVKIPIHIYAALRPNEKMEFLDNKTPLEYVSMTYGLDLDLLKSVGETGTLFMKEKETLVTI